jgi:hypothetical protein
MTRRRVATLALAALLAAGCGGNPVGHVKGRLTNNGQPVSFPPNAQAAVEFHRLGTDGKPDLTKVYSMMIETDGTFELLASERELPPGEYVVKLDVAGKDNARYKRFTARRQVKAGDNLIDLDLAKP